MAERAARRDRARGTTSPASARPSWRSSTASTSSGRRPPVGCIGTSAGRRQRRDRQQAPQRRRGVGAAELGPWACSASAVDVCFVEQIDAATCVDDDGAPAPFERSANRALLRGRDGAVRPRRTGRAAAPRRRARSTGVAHGRSCERRRRGRPARQHQRPPATCEPLMRGFRRRAYVDLDPGFTQFWHAAGHAGRSASRATTSTSRSARTSARPGCDIPTGGIDWRPRAAAGRARRVAGRRGAATRTASRRSARWRGAFGRGRVRRPHLRAEGARVPQGDRAAAARRRSTFEIALDIHPGDDRDRDGARGATAGGSSTRAPTVAGPARVPRLRAGLRRGVLGRAGHLRRDRAAAGSATAPCATWPRASRRSCRTPASARNYPVGEGLVAFRDARRGRRGRASGSPPTTRRTRAAARALAEEHFDSDKVLARFLDAGRESGLDRRAGCAARPRRSRGRPVSRLDGRLAARPDRRLRWRSRSFVVSELLHGDEPARRSRTSSRSQIVGDGADGLRLERATRASRATSPTCPRARSATRTARCS